MNEMMLNNPWNMQGIMDKIQNPMLDSIMNDSELRYQMLEIIKENQPMMQSLMENQQFMQQLNSP